MSSGVNINVDSATCWRTLSCQGTTRNGIDTCLILVIVREWVQPRFRHGVVTTGHSSFLPTLLRSELVVETVEIATCSKGLISPNSPLNPIDSSERDPRLDVNCCRHRMELSTTPDPKPPPLTIGSTYRQLLLVVMVRFPLPIDGPEQLVNLFLFHHWNKFPLPHHHDPHRNGFLVLVQRSNRRGLI